MGSLVGELGPGAGRGHSTGLLVGMNLEHWAWEKRQGGDKMAKSSLHMLGLGGAFPVLLHQVSG